MPVHSMPRAMTLNSGRIAVLCHVLILGLACGLFSMRSGSALIARRGECAEQREAADLASATSRPAINHTYTTELDRRFTQLLHESFDLRTRSSHLSGKFFERMAAWSGPAVFLVLIALFLVVRNQRLSRQLRLSIFTFHGLSFLTLASLFGGSVYGRMASAKVENTSPPVTILQFEASGHAQVGKTFTLGRHDTLFEILEWSRAGSGRVLDLWEAGEKMLATTPLSLAGLTVLNVIIISLVRRPSSGVIHESIGV